MLKMKDLIQEGRKIQETFKKNVIQESNRIDEQDDIFRKIARYITGEETLAISLSAFKPGQGMETSPSKSRTYSIAISVGRDILVKKYGMEFVSGERPGTGAPVFQIELDNTNKNEFTDSKVKQIVNEYIEKVFSSGASKEIQVRVSAGLYRRGKFTRSIVKSVRGGSEQTKMEF